jgi:hypothetical protein
VNRRSLKSGSMNRRRLPSRLGGVLAKQLVNHDPRQIKSESAQRLVHVVLRGVIQNYVKVSCHGCGCQVFGEMSLFASVRTFVR